MGALPPASVSPNPIPIVCVVPPAGIPLTQLCHGRGRCVDAGSAGHRCLCQDGYAGTYCQTPRDRCLPNPCLHGAACRSYGGGYECEVRDAHPSRPSSRCRWHHPGVWVPWAMGASILGHPWVLSLPDTLLLGLS